MPAPAPTPPTSTRLALIFSSLGHTYMHLMVAYFFVIVLPLEQNWGMPYAELIELWTVGAMLVGLMALPAGWLSDRWSAPGMMVVFFIGLGISAVACGLASSPRELWLGLCGLGAFAAIYHPVGIPWLVRSSSAARGKALGVNGIFGSVGVAGAGIVAGGLIDLSGWQTAFIVPGVISILTGLAMLACVRAGLVTDSVEAAPRPVDGNGASGMRAFAILVLTMLTGALIYQSAQVALPKVFALRLAAMTGQGTMGVGALIALVYGAAALTQVTAGHLADRYPLKPLYVGAFLLQIPCLWLVANAGGSMLVVMAALAVVVNVGSLPAENMLLASAAPQGRHGLVFGIKFVLAFGAAPLAIKLVAFFAGSLAGFWWVFVVLAVLAGIGCAAALLLPTLEQPDALVGATATL